MTPRQRVLALFAGARPDRVPTYHAGFSSAAASQVLGREAYVGGGIQQWREACAFMQGPEAVKAFEARTLQDAWDLTLATGQDVFRWDHWRLWMGNPTARIDQHTFQFGAGRDRGKVYQLDPQTELFQIVEQHGPSDQTESFEQLREHVERMERQTAGAQALPDASFSQGLLQRFGATHALRFGGAGLGIPYESLWLEALLVDPELIGRYLDIQVQRGLARIDLLHRAGARLVFGGGDFASSQGPFYSPQVFHDLLLPRLQRLTAACRSRDMHYLFASDGHLWPVAEDLFGRSGVSGFYEIDRRAGMDLRRLRQAFPRLVLFGNISSHTLHVGNPEQVIEETRDCLETAKELGGIVAGCSNQVVKGTPAENMQAMLRTIERHR